MPTIELEDGEEPQEPEDEEDQDEDLEETSSESDEEDDEGDEGDEELLLGVLATPEHPALMLRHYFPCKVGGKPAWLNPLNIPPLSALTCSHCKRPLKFLLQINAALEFESAFHRSLLLFVCPNAKCLAQGAVVAFRSQLPRKNPFYPYQPIPDPPPWEGPPVELDDEPFEAGPHLCAVCGLPGPKACSRCKKEYYCSQEHQRLHWKPMHSLVCKDTNTTTTTTEATTTTSATATAPETTTTPVIESTTTEATNTTSTEATAATTAATEIATTATTETATTDTTAATTTETAPAAIDADSFVTITIGKSGGDDSKAPATSRFKVRTSLGVLYPEKEIIIEPDVEETKEETVRKPVIEEEDPSFSSRSWKKLNKNAPSKQFLLFQATVAKAPEQVMRYQRGGKCLWVTAENQLESPPPCPSCHGPRVFEFQVLPQLLYYLGETASSVEEVQSSVDWGTLAVYTCEASCGDGTTAYFQEFVHMQQHEQ